MFRFKNKLYVEPSNVKKSWNKTWPEWWNTSTVEKSRYSGHVSVPIVAVNAIFHSFSLWVALSSVVILRKIFIRLIVSHRFENIFSWRSGQNTKFRRSNDLFRAFRGLTYGIDRPDRALNLVRSSWIFSHTCILSWWSDLTVGFPFLKFDHHNHNMRTNVV